jgi:hypothetical protein
VQGGPVVVIPGTVDGPVGAHRLLVQQARAVLVPNPSDSPPH